MNNINNEDNPTDSIYDIGYFNSNGKLIKDKISSNLGSIFITLLIALTFIQFTITRLNEYSLKAVGTLTIEFFHYNEKIILTLLNNGYIEIEAEYITMICISSLLAILTLTALFIKIVKRSKIQAALSSVGLSQYYFYKRDKKNIYLKFKKGHKNDYKQFSTQRENLSQILEVENLRFQRWKNNGVVLQFSDKFPTIEDLKGLDIKSFIKKDCIFLGIGIPKISEKIDKKTLIENKFIPRYLSIKDLPQGIANLGSSGGGKSNTMNQYLYSLFLNFNTIHSFIMIDFKGGIEAQPIKDLEDRCKTGKIIVLDDNRLALYKQLKLLYITNKARMRFLKANKKKKIQDNLIILIFDELAEILDYTPTNKDERKIQEKISFYIESLLRTGRSQNFKIFYSTQSYLSSTSGLSSGMKNNTMLKITHQLSSNLHVGTIKPMEEIEELGLTNPTKFDIGRNLIFNETNNTHYEVRSLYVEEDFIDSIEIEPSSNESFELALNPFYKEVLEEIREEQSEDDTLYPITDIAKDLNAELSFIEPIGTIQVNTKAPAQKTKPKSDFSNFLKKSSSSKNAEEDFINSIK